MRREKEDGKPGRARDREKEEFCKGAIPWWSLAVGSVQERLTAL